jgi:protoporphyrinogen/coproporphyrinogen III oxidase
LRWARYTVGADLPSAVNYDAWAKFDDEDAASWSSSRLGSTANVYAIEPLLGSFFFQTPEETSRAVPLAFWEVTKCKPLTLARGLGSLPETLASRVDVRFRSPVQSIELSGNGVRVVTSHDKLTADRVILATTSSAAKAVYGWSTGLEQRLMSTQYSSTVIVSIAAKKVWRDMEGLRKVVGLSIPRIEGGILSSVGIGSFKYRMDAPHGELLTAMLRSEVAIGMTQSSDEEIVRCIIPELEKYFPGLSEAILFTRVVRWPEAMPKSSLGRIRSIAEYRQTAPGTRRIFLAGDYMGLPWSESAAESGIWAANQILSA